MMLAVNAMLAMFVRSVKVDLPEGDSWDLNAGDFDFSGSHRVL
jgi:hypothetical protein